MDSRFLEIQQNILDATAAATELPAASILTTQEKAITNVDSWSKVGIWRLLCWIFSYVIWQHEKDVNTNLKNFRPQNRENLKAQIMNFHDGLALTWNDAAGAFIYDLTGVDDAEARMVIDRCAIRENNDGRLVIKIATDNSGELEPVAPDVEIRVRSYIDKIKVPGVLYTLINKTADSLKANLTAYVDPQLIDLTTGKLLNTTEDIKPVEVAAQDYLSKLQFNGAFVTNFFLAECIAADGIFDVNINSLEWKFDAFPYSDVGNFKIAEAGHFKLAAADLTINYLPYAVVDN